MSSSLRFFRSTLLNAVLVLGAGLLLHTVFVRVPEHLARQAEPSVPVLRLTAPDCVLPIERADRVAGRRMRANALNSALPAAPEGS